MTKNYLQNNIKQKAFNKKTFFFPPTKMLLMSLDKDKPSINAKNKKRKRKLEKAIFLTKVTET